MRSWQFNVSNYYTCQSISKPQNRGVFRYPYYPSSRVLNFWLPIVGCWKFKNLYILPKNFHVFRLNRQNLSFILGNLTDNQCGSRKSRVLICNINTPLPQNVVRLTTTWIVEAIQVSTSFLIILCSPAWTSILCCEVLLFEMYNWKVRAKTQLLFKQFHIAL